MNNKKEEATQTQGNLFSPKEEDVLIQLGNFSVDSDMCESLHITLNTLRTHIKNIKRKTGLRAREHLIRYARQHGYGAKEAWEISGDTTIMNSYSTHI